MNTHKVAMARVRTTVLVGAACLAAIVAPAVAGIQAAAAAPGTAIDAHATGSITGAVIDQATGLPLANDCNILVRARYDDDPPIVADPDYGVAAADPYVVKTFSGCLDDQGRYTISGLRPDNYALQVADVTHLYDNEWYDALFPGAGLVLGSPVAVAAGATTTQNLPIQKAGSITGTVSDASTGRPLAGDCNITIRADNGGHGLGQRYVQNGCTDDAGGYAIVGLTPGDYQVTFTQPGYVEQAWDHQNVGPTRPVHSIAEDITVGAGHQVSGIDASLTATAPTPSASGVRSSGPAAPVSAERSRQRVPLGATTGQPKPTGTSIEGVLKDAVTGKPLAHDCTLTVVLLRKGKNGSGGRDGTDHARSDTACTNADGSYVFDNVAAGRQFTIEVIDNSNTYYTRFYGGVQSIWRVRYTAATKAHRTTVANLGLYKYSTLSGTVYDAVTGDPLSGICVNDGRFSACTDANGRYAFADLLPYHSNYLQVEATRSYEAHAWRSREAAKLAHGQTGTGFDIPLVPAGTVTVALQDSDGSPLATTCGVTVHVWSTTDPESPQVTTTGCTDASGDLAVRDVVAGDQKVQVAVAPAVDTTFWYGGTDYASAQPVTVTTGGATTVTVKTS